MADGSIAGASRRLRLLLLEDSDIDAELLESHLQSGGRDVEILRAVDRPSFEKLLPYSPDIILADYALPAFDGMEALAIAAAQAPDVPFIFVSGVVGEEFATDALQQGAADYVTKRSLRRLNVAISRAISRSRERLERRELEAALIASDIGAKVALRAAKLGGWDYDPQRNVLIWDARVYAMFGLPEGQTVTIVDFLERLHPDDKDRVNLAMQRAITDPTQSSFSEQFRVITPFGALSWVESNGSAIFEGGKCMRFVGVVRDVTREKVAQIELLRRTESLEASVEQQAIERDLLWQNSQDLLVVLDENKRLRDVTPSWQRLLGTPAIGLFGRRFSDLLHADDRTTAERKLDRVRPQHPMSFESRILHADGSIRWFAWSASAGESGSVYLSGRNISEEKAAAERLQQVEDSLRQSQKMEAIGQLTGGIAHDFNNLLAGITGALDVIRRRLGQKRYDDLDRFVEAALTSSGRAASLTQRLLAFSRRQSLDIRPTDISKVVSAVDELLRRTVGENVRISVEMSDRLWHVNTDANQLENALLNLSINARDAMPDGGQLTIMAINTEVTEGSAALEAGQYVLLSVSDTGTGMSDDVLQKAFDPFFTTKPIGQGTGLGLSMVYGFVKQSGGQVRLTSELGKGTTIEIFLKRVNERASEARLLDGPAFPEAKNGEVVLVIEDDTSVRMLIIELLQDLGYEVHQAGDAQSALPIIQSDQRIDIIVSDVGLPGINGRELARRTRAIRTDVPILFVTGYADGALTRSEFLDPGMDMMLKPFDPDELARRIHSLITGSTPAPTTRPH